MQKGISLPIETVIVLVIAAVVLVALLYFFGSTFNPSVDRIRLQQQQVDLCTKYVSQDSECRKAAPTENDLKKNLDDTCTKLGLSTNPGACCSAFCPKGIRTRAECTAAGGGCQISPCTANTENTKVLGTCSDAGGEVNCCGKP